MPGISFHPSFHPAEIHPIEAARPAESKPGDKGSSISVSPVVKPENHPFSSSSGGLQAGSSPAKSVLQKATWPDKQGDYFVKTTDVPDADGSQPVYQRDDETGAPMLTHERARDDGHGNWKVTSHPDTAQPARRPALPPAAKIDPKQLGALKPDGTYPGGYGISYGRSAKGYHPLSYDRQLQVWMANDPERPHDFTRSVPAKLDGKGGIETFGNGEVGLKGGIHPRVGERMKVEQDVQEKEQRVQSARAAWEEAEANYRLRKEEADGYKKQLDQHLHGYTYMGGEHKILRDEMTSRGGRVPEHLKKNEDYFRSQKDFLANLVAEHKGKEQSSRSKAESARIEAEQKKKDYQQAQNELSASQAKLHAFSGS